MLKKLIGLTCIAVFALCTTSKAQVAQFIVTMNSGDFTLENNVGAPLAVNDVIQLGYYTTGLFGGTWVPLTGNGGANSAYTYTAIGGDAFNSPGPGVFTFGNNGIGNPDSSIYFQAGATTGNSFPLAGQQLTIRFYNATTVAGATQFNAITNSTWLWQTPANNSPSPNPELDISLNDGGIFHLQSTPSASFTYVGGVTGYSPSQVLETTLQTIPEPSSLAFLALALSMTAVAARFRKS